MKKETIEAYLALDIKNKEAVEFASELLRTAQDRFGHRNHKIERAGKEIEISESVMWREIFDLGPESQAGKFLKSIHPEVFEAYAKQSEIANEIKKMAVAEFGIDIQKTTLADYLRLILEVVDMKMSEHANK